MNVAFYGAARRVGTSANLEVIAQGLSHCVPVQEMNLFDCSHAREEEVKHWIRACDLFVINLSIPCPGLEEVCFRHSLVRENIIFLIGKYYHNNQRELIRLAKEYRMEPGRVCAIPYNLRFQKAYENRKVPEYLKQQMQAGCSCEDMEFRRNLNRTLHGILIYGKGERYYG